MNSKKYWEKRTAREAYEMLEDAEKVAEELKKAYGSASAYLQRQAEGLFEKFRQKYGLSEAEARRLLRSMKDSTSLNELMKKLQTCEQTEDVQELRKNIESAAYGARLRRLAEVQDSIDRLMKRLYGKTFKLTSDWLQKLAGEAYYKHLFEICQRAGFLVKFSGLSEKAIMKLLKTKWLGGDFSSRLWENTKALADRLKQELLVSLLTGRTDRETANIINNEFRKGASAARRLVRTESNHVYTEARFEGAEECGIEKYIFLATLDLRTSKICRSLDGKIFRIKDRKVGTNCPPMHPWCRSTTLDYFGEEWLKNGTRFALDPVTGKRIKVPMSMTYKEWYDKYVNGHEKDIAEKQPQSRNLTRDQYDRYRRRGVGPDSYEEFIKLKGDPEAWAKLQEEYRKAKEVPKKSKKKKAAQPKVEDKAAEVVVEPEKTEHEQVYRDQRINGRKVTETVKEPGAETKKDSIDGELQKHYEYITDKWFPDAIPGSNNVERIQKIFFNGEWHSTDEPGIKFKTRPNEKRVAELLARKVGGQVYLRPEINEPQRIPSPDIEFNGIEYDIKTLEEGPGKNKIFNRVKKSSNQCKRFIVDISNTQISDAVVDEQIDKIFWSKETQFVKEIAIVRDNAIIRVARRK